MKRTNKKSYVGPGFIAIFGNTGSGVKMTRSWKTISNACVESKEVVLNEDEYIEKVEVKEEGLTFVIGRHEKENEE